MIKIALFYWHRYDTDMQIITLTRVITTDILVVSDNWYIVLLSLSSGRTKILHTISYSNSLKPRPLLQHLQKGPSAQTGRRVTLPKTMPYPTSKRERLPGIDVRQGATKQTSTKRTMAKADNGNKRQCQIDEHSGRFLWSGGNVWGR